MTMEVNKAMEHERIENVDTVPDRGHRRPRDEDDASSIRSEALGDDIPKGYFRSISFIGALTVICPPKDSNRRLRSELDSRAFVFQQYLHTSFC